MSLSMTEHALQYSKLGWLVFPVGPDKSPLTPNGFYDGTTDEGQIRKWWQKFPGAGIGVATGKLSGIVVLDLDDKPGAMSGLKDLIKNSSFEMNVVSRTGGGGYHFFFKYPQGVDKVANAVGLHGYPGLDIRGDAGYVVLPPSPHLSGNRYEWGDSQSPFEAPLSECPPFMYEGREKAQGFDFAGPIEDGRRNTTLTSIAGVLRAMGLDHPMIVGVLKHQNMTRCVPPLEDSEVETIAKYTMDYPPRYNRGDGDEAPPEDVPVLTRLLSFPRTDTGFAEMLAFHNLGHLKFNHQTGEWLLYRKDWWVPDEREEVIQRCIEVGRLFLQATTLVTEEDARREAEKYARQLQQRHKMDQALSILRSLPVIATVADQWDRDTYLLGVEGGVVDLRTGEFRRGRPEDMISRHCGTTLGVASQATRWVQFLDEIFEGDQEIIDFVQRALGYSLTGDTREQVLFLLVGNGSNGKSVLLDAISELMGHYGHIAPFSTFERSMGPNSQQTNDLAALVGKRVVIASETNEGHTFDEARLKRLTGGEKISARKLYKDFFEFRFEGKIWLAVNHAPRVRDDSDGFWRRVRRIDFNKKFEGASLDPTLGEKLKQELPHILAWMIEGVKKWHQKGLGAPDKVKNSTQLYRRDADPLSEFLMESCEIGEGQSVLAAQLYVAYQGWANKNGFKSYDILGSNTFHGRIGRLYPRLPGNGPKTYGGIHLKEGLSYLSDVPVIVIKRTPNSENS